MSRWLSSFSQLKAIIVIKEPKKVFFHRIKAELRRTGIFRLIDVVVFKLYYKLFLSRSDHQWLHKQLIAIKQKYQDISDDVKIIFTDNPNSDKDRKIIADLSPDIIIARCKTLLKREIYSIPLNGTFVIHPGICPQYRNSHGCFWALANNDLSHVGVTLLKINDGIDTGPVYGYYYYPFDEMRESHIRIQYKTVIENLDNIQKKLVEINALEATAIDTSASASKNYGQVWATGYVRWKYNAMKRNYYRSRVTSLLYHDVIIDHQYDASGFSGGGADLYKLELSLFVRQMQAIRDCNNGAPVIVYDLERRKNECFKWMLTFDDGGKSSMLIADLLDQYGWKGHFFITTSYINHRGFLTTDDIKSLHQRGHVIGSHSHTHPARMSSLSNADLLSEWLSSLDVLSKICGSRIEVASVPGGYYSRKTAEMAQKCGIKWLFTSEPVRKIKVIKNCLILGRYSIQKNTKPCYQIKIISGNVRVLCRLYIIWNIKKILKFLGGKYYTKIRSYLLNG